MTRARLLLAAFVLFAVLFPRRAEAHAMRTAYVEVVERSPGRALVTLGTQVPVTGVRLSAEAPCTLQAADDTARGALLLDCPNGTVGGATLVFEGLGPILSEAVVWTVLADGTSSSTLVTHDRAACVLPTAGASAFGVARQYVGLGVRHILTGFDHLLFLLGLVVVLRRVRAVLLAETAFTLSHTLSFTAAALGWVHVSTGAVEACIALSLVLVALDATRRRDARMPPSALRGAGLAFAFGLVHGLGFAGGLAEIGLPTRAIPSALAGFAAGVELGQVAFLALVLAAFALARRVRAASAERVLATVATYAVGAVGCFWLFERLRALFLTHT